MASSSDPGCSKSLRSNAGVEDLQDIYPLVHKFDKEKLPTHNEVIGLVRKYSEEGHSFGSAIHDVSNVISEHWISRNVYPLTVPGIKKKLSKEIDEFRYLTRTDKSKRGKKWMDRYEKFASKRTKLFDVFCENQMQRATMEEKYSVPMLDEDYDYLKSMRSDRKMKCEGKVDSKWHHEAERLKSRRENYVKNQTVASSTVSSLDISVDTNSTGTDDDTSSQCSDLETVQPDESSDLHSQEQLQVRKKARFMSTEDTVIKKTNTRSSTTQVRDIEASEMSEMPEEMCHIRHSERNVRDEVYWCMAELDGLGFSYKESQKAIVTVGNLLFGRKWKMPTESQECENDESVFDRDTLPTEKNIRRQLKNIEAYSLKLVGDKVIDAKESGATITHATDSTTRKYVGSFAPAGLHINRDEYVPLPTLPISSETTKNVADSIVTDFRLLEAASGHSAEDLYAAVDVHMTDSTSHNKGIAELVGAEFNRADKAGQIFCDTHTALGFDRGMNKQIHDIEEKMGIENIFSTFLLDVDIDQKKDSVSMTAVSWCLNLFGPDNIQKPWNYNKDFCLSVRDQGKEVNLFHLKDARFGALSKSCAIMCYHWNDFYDFLEAHEYITNKLACLVRDALELEYIKIVAAVIAIIGIQLVTPFHAITISKGATHSSLKEKFVSLHHELKRNDVSEQFFNLDSPAFSCFNEEMFQDVKANYGLHVVDCVKQCAQSHLNECIALTRKILPEMANVLAMQRGKYYGFGDHQQEYPVFDQCEDIDKTPVHNLEMERQCGDTDQRLKKKPKLEAVARGTVLKETSKLRSAVSSEYRKMSPVVKVMDDIKLKWKQDQIELQAIGLSNKEARNLRIENRKLNILEKLKEKGGPFTSEEEVDYYLATTKNSNKEKTQRMRDEVTYARDTSLSLPKASPVFRIFNTSGKKRIMLTPEEFGCNLKKLLGKKKERSIITLTDFQKALNS